MLSSLTVVLALAACTTAGDLPVPVSAGDDDDDDEVFVPVNPLDDDSLVFGRIRLGIVEGNTVRLFAIDDLSTPVVTTSSQDLSSGSGLLGQRGLIPVPVESIEADTTYLVVADGGGLDLDPFNTGALDLPNAQIVEGELHAILTGAEILAGDWALSIPTEAAYQASRGLLAAGYEGAVLEAQLSNLASQLFASDTDGSGSIDNLDLAAFDPLFDNASPATSILRLAADDFNALQAELVSADITVAFDTTAFAINAAFAASATTELFAVAGDGALALAFTGGLGASDFQVGVAAGSAGVLVADASDEVAPALVASSPSLAGDAIALAGDNNDLFIGESAMDGLEVFELMGNTLMFESSFVTTSQPIIDVALDTPQVMASAGTEGLFLLSNDDTPPLDVNAQIDSTNTVSGFADGSITESTTVVSLESGGKKFAFSGDTATISNALTGNNNLDATASIKVYDVSNPTTPVFVAAADTLAVPVDMATTAQNLFVSTADGGVELYAVQFFNGEFQIALIGYVDLPGNGGDIDVDGNLIYIATGEAGVQVVDAGAVLNFFDDLNVFDLSIGVLGSPVADDGLIPPNVCLSSQLPGNRLSVPVQPLTYLGQIATAGPSQAVLVEDQDGVSRGLSASTEAGLELFDASVPQFAAVSGDLTLLDNTPVFNLMPVGDDFLLSQIETNFCSFASTAAASGVIENSATFTRTLSGAGDPLPFGSLSLLSGEDLSALDVLTSLAITGIQDVAVNGNQRFVAAGATGVQAVLQSVDGDSNPVLTLASTLGSGALGGEAVNISFTSTPSPLLLVGLAGDGFAVIDASDTNLVAGDVSAQITGIGEVQSVTVNQGFAYVALAEGGLAIYTLAGINSGSTPVTTVAATDAIFGSTVLGNLLYVADGRAGVRVFDISAPANPVAILDLAGDPVTVDTEGVAHQVVVDGAIAYVADGAGGVAIFDIANAALPLSLGQIAVPGSPTMVTVTDTAVLTFGDGGGFSIVNPFAQPLP